ncbi:hypothetical protein [Methanosarcina sp. DH2]|nr:hypothetical protein [Methanosarcina sp. DH2]
MQTSPSSTVAFLQITPGTKGVIIGMTMFPTSGFIRAVDAYP